MRIPRIYQNKDIQPDSIVQLDEDTSHYLAVVLRLAVGDSIHLFNGNGNKYSATIIELRKNTISVKVTNVIPENHESSLKIHLGQSISKGERMDWLVQKSTELGIYKISPLFSERCEVHLKGDRIEKRQMHWQKIANSACEQSGRNFVPEIERPMPLLGWIMQKSHESSLIKLILLPNAEKTLNQVIPFQKSKSNDIAVLIGPEGGLSDTENEYAISKGFIPIKLGPRILRTETAAIAVISILQYLAGDLG